MKRKNFLTIVFSITITGLLFNGCIKKLDLTPDGRITLEDVFKTNQGTLSYLNTAYSNMATGGDYYYWITLLGGITDDGFDSDITEPYVMATKWYNGGLSLVENPIHNPENFVNSYDYANLWSGIRRCNVFLAHIDNAVLTNSKDRARLKAEAIALRAHYYFTLIKAFGPMPIFKEPIPATFDYQSVSRPTMQEIVDAIVEDCNAAIAEPDLPWRITRGEEAGRFTKAVAYAIKSDALMWNASPLWNPSGDRSKWEAAATASKEAIVALTGIGYEIYKGGFEEYFNRTMDYNSSPSDRESILETQNYFRHYPFGNQMPNLPGVPQLKAGVCPTQELVDSYDMAATGEPAILGYNDEDHLIPIINPASGYDEANPYVGRDPRFYYTVWYNDAVYGDFNGVPFRLQIYEGGLQRLATSFLGDQRSFTQTGYYLRKYMDSTDRSEGSALRKMKIYRLATLYLNYAEAENEANGPTQDVYNAVNTIRSRPTVNMPNLPAGLSKDEMRKRIRNEKRVESPYEELRFWDVRRWKILDKTDKVTTGMRSRKEGGSFVYERFVVYRKKCWSDKFLIFPIPLGEDSKVPLFEQNPGW